MLRSADLHYAQTRALVARAVREARRGDVSVVVARHQATAALGATVAISAMLAEQGTPVAPEAAINPLAFTTSTAVVESLAAEADEAWRFDRLIAGLITDAARAAESVTITTRPRVGYVRYLSPPSCSRCAILAGRFYRWSDGFKRHPGCDCTHLPTTDPRSEFIQNPHDLVDKGLVTGLSKADRRALADGADLNQLVNAKVGSLRRVNFGQGRTVTTTTAGTTVRGAAGRSLGDLQKQAGSRYRVSGQMRLTPDSIYRVSGGDRDMALSLLKKHGYIR